MSTSFTILPLQPTITFDRAEATDGDFILATITFNDNEGAFIGLESSPPGILVTIGSENNVFAIDGSGGTVLFQVREVEQPTPVTVTAVVTNSPFFGQRGATGSTTVTVCPPAGCSPEPTFRIIAQRLDGGARQTRDIDSSGSVAGGPVEFFLGEQFQVEVVEVNPDGSDGATVSAPMMLGPRTVAPAPIQSQVFTQPTRLFADTVLILFTGSSPVAEFLPVHSGTADILVTVPNPSGGPGATREVTLPVTIPTCPTSGSCGFRLGNTRNQFDDDIIRFADLRGIPPQIIKGHVDQEAAIDPATGQYRTDSYRYEPLSVDWRYVSRGLNFRDEPRYRPYRLETFSDSQNPVALPQGAGLTPTDIVPRQRFFIQVDASGVPLREVPEATSRFTSAPERQIVAGDRLISMENILYSNDSRHSQQNWSAENSARWQRFGLARRARTETPFAAQTVIAASYGLMQILYDTAVDVLGYGSGTGANRIGRSPASLLDSRTSMDLGTEFVSAKFVEDFASFGSDSEFPGFGDIETLIGFALERYNRRATYPTEVLQRSTRFQPARVP